MIYLHTFSNDIILSLTLGLWYWLFVNNYVFLFSVDIAIDVSELILPSYYINNIFWFIFNKIIYH